MCLSRLFLKKWVKERKGKKCAIIDISSCCAEGASNMLAEYSATKAFNKLLSKSIHLEYKKNMLGEDGVDLDVLTVYPHSTKSQMNSGRYTFTVTSEQHAKAVIDRLGWESETSGHWIHGFKNHFVIRHCIPNWINDKINASRRLAFAKEQNEKTKKELEEKEKAKPKPKWA